MPGGGSKPGERRGGRHKGVPNKVTADVRAAAQKYTAEAIETLASIMRNSEADQARIAAANALLDRGHGKATQPVDATLAGKDGGPVKVELYLPDNGRGAVIDASD